MKDPAKVGQLIAENMMEALKKQQQEFIARQDAAKITAQEEMYALLGAPTKADLTKPKTPASDYSSTITEQRATLSKLPPDSPMGRYAAWVERRRVGEAALDAQLDAIHEEANGKPLDWAGHMKLATKLYALQNDRLALSMAETVAAIEARTQEQAAIARYYRAENDAAERANVERRIRRP